MPNSSTAYLNATVGGSSVNAIANQVLGDSTTNDFAYITVGGAPDHGGLLVRLASKNVVAVSPDGTTVFGVNSSEGLLVVANAATSPSGRRSRITSPA